MIEIVSGSNNRSRVSFLSEGNAMPPLKSDSLGYFLILMLKVVGEQ